MSRADTNPVNAWSRRRAAVKAEARADARAAELAKQAEEQAALEEMTDAEILNELNLQDPDTLQPGDDFSAFMQSTVPERLRRRALRTLWRSNPVLANVDDLVDYGEDFKAESIAGAVIKTTYQVGKGMLKHIDEMEKQAREADPLTPEDAKPDTATPEAPSAPQVDMAQVDMAVAENPLPRGEDIKEDLEGDIEEDTPMIQPKRRMRFAFEEAG